MSILKKEDVKVEESQPVARPAPKKGPGEVIALLGQGATFEGKLTFEGTVRIDGRFKGNIFSDATLVVGEGAKVDAEIDIGTLVVNGEVRGNVRARKGVELHSPARLYGNLYCPSLQMERGVIFEGECRMENLDKMKDVPKAVPAIAAPPAPRLDSPLEAKKVEGK